MTSRARASEALEQLQRVAPGSIIAGGYLRDTFFKVEPKDIDFFAPFGVTLAQVQLAFPDAKLETFSRFLEYTTEEVSAVYDLGLIDGGLPGQLIVLNRYFDPAERVGRMDFGFCQIYETKPDSLKLKDAFYRDWIDNTATLVHCENPKEFARSMRRWARLSKKYPDRKLVIPEEYQKWM